MYDRKTKNISDHTWMNLMKEPSASELLKTIKQIPRDKAAGYDGVEINLIKLLTEDVESPLVTILLLLFKIAFTVVLEEIRDYNDSKKKRGWVLDG